MTYRCNYLPQVQASVAQRRVTKARPSAVGIYALDWEAGFPRISEAYRSGRKNTWPEHQEQEHIINICITHTVRYARTAPYICKSFSPRQLYMTLSVNLSTYVAFSLSLISSVIWFSFDLSCKRHRQCGGGRFWWLLPLGQYMRLPETNGSVGQSTKWSPIASLDLITQPPLLVMQHWESIVEGAYRASSPSSIIFRNSGSMQFGYLQCKVKSQLARQISQVWPPLTVNEYRELTIDGW